MSTYSQRMALQRHKGYQEALRDVRDALERGGVEAVQQWLADNLLVQA